MGSAILGGPGDAPPAPEAAAQSAPANESWWRSAVRRISGVGKPLLLGLAIMATVVGFTTYFLVSAAWKVAVLWKLHRRRRRRR